MFEELPLGSTTLQSLSVEKVLYLRNSKEAHLPWATRDQAARAVYSVAQDSQARRSAISAPGSLSPMRFTCPYPRVAITPSGLNSPERLCEIGGLTALATQTKLANYPAGNQRSSTKRNG